MKAFWFCVGLIAVIAWSGYWAWNDPGYIMIQHGSWSFEMTAFLGFWILMPVLLLGGTLVHWSLNLLTFPQGLKRWRQARKALMGRQALDQGLINYLVLRSGLGSQGLDKAAEAYGDSPVGALLYAEVLVEHGRQDEALKQLEDAEHRFPDRWELPALRCQRLFEMDQLEAAQSVLEHLRAQFPKATTLPLLEYLWAKSQEDWDQARQWLNKIRKQKRLPVAEIELLESEWHRHQLAEQLQSSSASLISGTTEMVLDPEQQQSLKKQTQKWWKQLPPGLQKNNDMRQAYLNALIRLGLNAQVIKEAKPWILEGQIHTLYPILKQLNPAESHLKAMLEWAEQQNSDSLQLLIAEQEMGLEQWPQAQQRLESLAQSDNRTAKELLLFLYLKTGQPMAAKQLASSQVNT